MPAAMDGTPRSFYSDTHEAETQPQDGCSSALLAPSPPSTSVSTVPLVPNRGPPEADRPGGAASEGRDQSRGGAGLSNTLPGFAAMHD